MNILMVEQGSQEWLDAKVGSIGGGDTLWQCHLNKEKQTEAKFNNHILKTKPNQ